MKKVLSLLLPLAIIVGVFFSSMPAQEEPVAQLVKTNYTYTIVDAITKPPVIMEASVITTIWEFIKQLDWGGVIALLFAGGFVSIIASVKKSYKEVMDVYKEFKKAKEDGKVTEKEMEGIIKELEEALLQVNKTWYMIAGIFTKKKPNVK